jgi:hypothetical protein
MLDIRASGQRMEKLTSTISLHMRTIELLRSPRIHAGRRQFVMLCGENSSAPVVDG